MPSRDRRDVVMPSRTSGRDSFAAVGITSGGPPLGRWAALAVLILVVAVVKPWGSTTIRTPIRATPVHRVEAASPTHAAPTVNPFAAGPVIASICLDPPSWRIATTERWRDQTIRVWRAMVPRAIATGPEDSRVPITSLVSEGVIELGWCAPVLGNVRISGDAAVEVWRRTADGASRITMTSQRPGPGTSPYGALYGSPAAPLAALWNDGTYVFHHRAADGEESWFGVDVERRPSTGSRG